MPLRKINREQIWLLPPTLDEVGDYPVSHCKAVMIRAT